MTATITLDAEALRELQEIMSEVPGGLTVVVGAYLSDAPEHLAEMRKALAARDGEALRDAAHSLKSTSATLGVTALMEVCRELESAARAGRFDLAVAMLTTAEELFAAAEPQLRAVAEQGG